MSYDDGQRLRATAWARFAAAALSNPGLCPFVHTSAGAVAKRAGDFADAMLKEYEIVLENLADENWEALPEGDDT